jgi:choline/glycine/proline betaine transport protein
MLERLSRRLGLEANPVVFFTSALLAVAFVALTIAFTEPVADLFTELSEQVLDLTGWFYVLGVTTFLIFLLWVALSRYGRLRLGEPIAFEAKLNVERFDPARFGDRAAIDWHFPQ